MKFVKMHWVPSVHRDLCGPQTSPHVSMLSSDPSPQSLNLSQNHSVRMHCTPSAHGDLPTPQLLSLVVVAAATVVTSSAVVAGAVVVVVSSSS